MYCYCGAVLIQVLLWNECLNIALPIHVPYYWERALLVWGRIWRGNLDGHSLQMVGFMGGWKSWMWLGFSWPCFLCSAVGVAGMRMAPVCGVVVWLMSVRDVASVGRGATMPVWCVKVQVAMGASISQRAVQAAVVAAAPVLWEQWLDCDLLKCLPCLGP